MTQEEFIKRAKERYGDKYDYSKVIYTNCKNKVCIICPEHGEFWQTPDNHLHKSGCPKCGYIITSKKLSLNKEEFIRRACEIHGNKYDYSKVEYINNRTKVCIICPEHGEFWQIPSVHIDNKAGCPFCSKNHKYTTKEFIYKLREVYDDIYDFSKIEYTGTHNKVCVICKKHGEFWQTPHNLLKGIACKKCQESILEKNIRKFLENSKIDFIYEDKPVKMGKQSIDFFLPKYNLGIECQGRQHFEPVDFGSKGDEWAVNECKHIQYLDKQKYNLCKKNNIQIVYYIEQINKEKSNLIDFYNDKEIITDPYQILNYIDESL